MSTSYRERVLNTAYRAFDESFHKAMAQAEAAGKKHPIIGAKGEVSGTSRNLAGIIRAIGKGLVEFVEIAPVGGGQYPDGILRVRFDDGRQFETHFASYEVLKHFVTQRRNLHGVPLFISGKRHGEVSSKNPV